MRPRVVEALSSAAWLVAAIGFMLVGLVPLGSYVATLGPPARGSWATSDRFLTITTDSEIQSEALEASLRALPPGQPVFVIGPVDEVEHWYGLWYLVGYLGWPHPVPSLMCRGPGQMNDWPPLPGPDAPAGTAVVLLKEHPTWIQDPTVFSPTLSMVSKSTEARPWNSFCQ